MTSIVSAEKSADMPMPMRTSFVGLLLLPTKKTASTVATVAPRRALNGTAYAPRKANAPQMIAQTAPVLAPEETPST